MEQLRRVRKQPIWLSDFEMTTDSEHGPDRRVDAVNLGRGGGCQATIETN
jgi:hypothetical protein